MSSEKKKRNRDPENHFRYWFKQLVYETIEEYFRQNLYGNDIQEYVEGELRQHEEANH